MANQFIRAYSLTIIGDTGTKVITDLRIHFEVTKSNRSYPNIAKIDLYNPNDNTVALITNGDPLFILNAGYLNNIGLIFTGRLRNVFDNQISVDRVITIYAGDGQREWEKSIFNKTFNNTVDLPTLVNDVLSTFTGGDVSIGTIEDIEGRSADKLIGVTLSGSSVSIMNQLADDYNFVWSIQDNEIIVTGDNKPLEANQAVLIKQTTGMIGSPTLTILGADVTTLLNPQLLPNVAFQIESESTEVAIGGIQFRELRKTRAEGLYNAVEVLFIGDTHGAQWHSTAKGVTFSG